jgi:hypothetical protein
LILPEILVYQTIESGVDMEIIPINILGEIEVLEPRCGKCQSKLDYGTNTKYDLRLKCHVCENCGNVLK